MAFADRGYTGGESAPATFEDGTALQMIKLEKWKKGFVSRARRWTVKHSFGWLDRFRLLARDCEGLPETLAGLH